MRDRSGLLLALGAVAIVLAYANSLGNSFHFDDAHVIENNLYIRSLHNIPRFFTDADTFSSLPSNATYRPLVTLSFAIDYALAGGLDPRQFHVTQIVLLILFFVMLAHFYKRVMLLGGPEIDRAWINGAAVIGATWFAVHTGNCETMNLISARSELIAAIGVVGAFLVYIDFPSLRRYGLFIIPMLLGGLAKAPVIVFAPLLLVFMILFEERWRTALVKTLPVFAVCIVLAIFLGKMNDPRWSSGGGDRLDYLRTQPWVWLHYFRLFFIPAGLTADSDLGAIPWWDTRFFAGLAFLALLALAIVVTTRTPRLRPAAFGLWWFVIALIPTSSFFPLAELANDHRLFFPFIGLTLAVVWCAALALATRTREALALAAIVIAANVGGTIIRNKVWLSEETLWRDVTIKSPMNGRGLMNYGLTLMAKGQLEQARDYFQRALAFTPNYATLEINLGIVNGSLGNTAEAERHFQRALSLRDDAEEHFFYARWLIKAGRVPEALTHLHRALEIVPASPMTRSLLMRTLAARGENAELGRVARETLQIVPGDPEATMYLEVARTAAPK